jgi:hypothetical protein
MSLPRVYADFNAIEGARLQNVYDTEMPLTGYGTLGSLARQGLRLTEGMAVLVYEPNDVECEAVVYFDRSRKDPAGRAGEWVACFDQETIRDSTLPWETRHDHPCLLCGCDFAARFPITGRRYTEKCVNCGASVMEPLAPPG